jgi:lysophospholipase L1-like esterase
VAKLPLHALVERIQSGKITEKEIGQSFLIQQNPDRPFDFLIGINPENVDIARVESAALLAKPLLHDASIMLDQRMGLRRTAAAKFRRKGPIIAEGDSWFRLPSWFPGVPDTLVDELEKNYPIVNLAHWGDTLSEIILRGEFWPYILPATGQSDVLMFSAGGNDVVGNGELWRFLNLFDVDHADPSDAAYYVRQEFYDNLELIVGNYRGLIESIRNRAPNVIVAAHGYGYVSPKPGGPWLYEPMTRQGLYYEDRPKLCQAILNIMIDAFNNRLSALQQAYPSNFRYVNLRKALNASDWWDELHAKTSGAQKLAREYARVLDKLPASRAAPPPVATTYYRALKAA